MEACGVPGPQGPDGADGSGGDAGLTTTTVRLHEEVIEMTCSEPSNGAEGYAIFCNGAEEIRAECEPGEVATGGSVGPRSQEDQFTPGTGDYSVRSSASDDRPDPLSGTPTAWAADARASASSSSYTADPPATPPDLSVKVYAVCAS